MNLKDIFASLKERLKSNKDNYVDQNSWMGDTVSGFYTETTFDIEALYAEIDEFSAELAERTTAQDEVLTKIPRFNIDVDAGGDDIQEVPYPTGDFCRFEDVQALLAAAAPAPIQQGQLVEVGQMIEFDDYEDPRFHTIICDWDNEARAKLTAGTKIYAVSAGSQVQAVGDAGKVQAIKSAVSAICFDDDSDYGTALWEVVQALDPAMAKLLEENPSAAYSQADAAAMREQP